MRESCIYQSDWLGSDPVFYNSDSGLASRFIREVMDCTGPLEFHDEGLFNYLNFGYSVFGQSPVANIKFLSPHSALYKTESGELREETLADPFASIESYRLSESDLIELIRERVQAWETRLPDNQRIILPLSGGFDSRLLLWAIKDKSRVSAFSYGTADTQSNSFEVVRARALAEKFAVDWQFIPITNQHRFMREWYKEYGVSTHAHGMYHYDFYAKIRTKFSGPHALLSGIVGDLWAGSLPRRNLRCASSLAELAYAHGLRCDPKILKRAPELELLNTFWQNNQQMLQDHRYQVLTTVRIKMILLSYLLRVPEKFGFHAWSPFLDHEVALGMLNLPPERRRARVWQREFFAKEGLDLEDQGLGGSSQNSLNFQGQKSSPLEPLELLLQRELIERRFLARVNQSVRLGAFSRIQNRVATIPKLGGALRRLGLRPWAVRAFNAYLCLFPLEMLLREHQDRDAI